MDDKFYQFTYELEKEYKKSVKTLNNTEIIKLFLPEAKDTMKIKIKELKDQKEEIERKIKDKLDYVNKNISDEFTIWFAKHWISVEFGGMVIDIETNISRLNRMLSLCSNKKPKKGQITDKDIEQAKSIPIMEIIERYLTLKKVGKNYSALCPFHNEKHPSFIVFPESNRFHCFSCQKTGDGIAFVELMDNCNFIQAIKSLI